MKALAASCEHWDSQDWRSRRAHGVRRRVNEQVGRPLTISIDRAGRVVANHAQSWSPGNSNGCEAIPSVVETKDCAQDAQAADRVDRDTKRAAASSEQFRLQLGGEEGFQRQPAGREKGRACFRTPLGEIS